MSSLTMVEASLPPGFRFHPRDDELVCDYLINKWNNNGSHHSSFLLQLDLNKCEPWDIPETVCVGGKEWYFYSQRDRKYATGLRTNRATASGYWKATGKDRPVFRRGSLVGMRKTLVFYQGRAPKGNKTNWVMHEFRVEGPFLTPPTFSALSKQEDWVLCRVFLKKKESRSKSDQAQNDSTNNSVEETSSSTLNTLPPLMDSYITFHQTQPNNNINNNNNNNNINNNNNNNNNEQVQVPCFSMRSSSDNYNYPIMQQFHPNNDLANHDNYINQGALSCDKKVVEAFLTHLTKMESSLPSPTLNATPYAALPTHMWNHY